MSQLPEPRVELAQSAREPAPGASRLRNADPAEVFSVSLRLRRRADAKALDLAALGAAPVGQRTYLSREDYAAQQGASPADFDAVANFALNYGLKVVETSTGRRTAVLSGTAAQMNAAFGVELGMYHTSRETYRGHEGSITLPATLAPIVEGVFGLDNRQVVKPLFRALAAPVIGQPLATTPLLPTAVAKLYDFPAVSAAGQTVGIIEFGGGFKASDVQAYFQNTVKLPVPAITVVGVDGASNSPGGSADLEVILDIDVAGSVAQGAKLVVYFAPNTLQGFIDVFTTAIHDSTNKPSVLSVSWGGGESGFGQSAANQISAAIAEAQALGVSILVSSGDSGSMNPAQVEYPAADPGVTACGGTTISNVSGSSFTQTVWGGSGGGVSNLFAKPSWQSWAGVPASINPAGHVGRGVPDVAGNADPASGYMLILNGASTGPIGGTSAVAPLYAGLVALLNASLGEPLGYLNPNLYAFAGPEVFHDITSGSNGGYSAKAGYDACTGWGSIDGNGMLNALWGVGLPPALLTVGSSLLMTWKGIERDDRIFSTTFNGSSWAPQAQIGGIATSSGTALASFNGRTVMAWKGMNADQGIYFSTLTGSSWAPQKLVSGVGTSTGPRLAAYGGKLYMAWKGVEGDQAIYWSSYNGSSWSPQQVIPGVASSVGPALSAFGNGLVAVWKGMYGDPGIYWSVFNGSSWSAQKNIAGVGTSEGPSLAVYNGQLIAAWKGQYADQRLWWSSFNGSTWTPQQMIPGVWSSVGPGLGVLGSKLYMVWKGMLGDQRIWYTYFNGTAWAPQQVVPGVGTSPDL